MDNASTDGSPQMVAREFPEARLIRNQVNAGFARANNQGLAPAQGEAVLFLNQDAEIRPGAITAMAHYLQARPEAGAVGAWLLNPDGSFQNYFHRFPTPALSFFCETELGKRFDRSFLRGRLGRRYRCQDVDFAQVVRLDQPPAACLMVKRALLSRIGGMDERFPIFFNDVDLCRRIWRAGFEIHLARHAHVLHHLAQSTRSLPRAEEARLRSLLAYFRKHYGLPGALVWKTLLLLDCCYCGLMTLRNRIGARTALRQFFQNRLQTYLAVLGRSSEKRFRAGLPCPSGQAQLVPRKFAQMQRGGLG